MAAVTEFPGGYLIADNNIIDARIVDGKLLTTDINGIVFRDGKPEGVTDHINKFSFVLANRMQIKDNTNVINLPHGYTAIDGPEFELELDNRKCYFLIAENNGIKSLVVIRYHTTHDYYFRVLSSPDRSVSDFGVIPYDDHLWIFYVSDGKAFYSTRIFNPVLDPMAFYQLKTPSIKTLIPRSYKMFAVWPDGNFMEFDDLVTRSAKGIEGLVLSHNGLSQKGNYYSMKNTGKIDAPYPFTFRCISDNLLVTTDGRIISQEYNQIFDSIIVPPGDIKIKDNIILVSSGKRNVAPLIVGLNPVVTEGGISYYNLTETPKIDPSKYHYDRAAVERMDSLDVIKRTIGIRNTSFNVRVEDLFNVPFPDVTMIAYKELNFIEGTIGMIVITTEIYPSKIIPKNARLIDLWYYTEKDIKDRKVTITKIELDEEFPGVIFVNFVTDDQYSKYWELMLQHGKLDF